MVGKIHTTTYTSKYMYILSPITWGFHISIKQKEHNNQYKNDEQLRFVNAEQLFLK